MLAETLRPVPRYFACRGRSTWRSTATLSLGSATSTQVTARLRSSDISALAGADYHAINRLVSFAPNTTEQRIDIPLINDLMDEDRETFTIELHDKSDEQRLPLDYIHVTILDEDGVTMTVRNARANESKREILHFIDLSEGVTWPIRFRAKTVDGTATAPEDYSPRDRSGTHVPDDLEPGQITDRCLPNAPHRRRRDRRAGRDVHTEDNGSRRR